MLAFPPTPQARMGPGLRRDDVRGAHLKRLLCTLRRGAWQVTHPLVTRRHGQGDAAA